MDIDKKNISYNEINGSVCLNPLYICKDIERYILETIKQNYCNKCDVKFGLILDVDKKIKSYTTKISNTNSSIIVYFNIEAYTINPKIGDIIYGKCEITDRGVFIDVAPSIKCLISNRYYDKDIKFVIESDIKMLKYKNGKIFIKDGDIINSQVKVIRFTKKNNISRIDIIGEGINI